MLINFIGTRGTHPSSGQGTMSFLVDNKIVFDICPEFVMSYTKFVESWNRNTSEMVKHFQNLYGSPGFAKIEHIFISHLHYDHWGGLRHLLIWSQMFEGAFREQKPIHVYIPKKNLELFQLRLKDLFQLPEKQYFEETEFFLRYLMVEIDVSIAKFVRIHALEHTDIIKIGRYEIQSFENKHFRGSLSYKIQLTKYTLNEMKLDLFAIPKGPLLGKLQKEGTIEFQGKIITVEQVFNIKKTILGYSGDTQIDLELLNWFSDCTHLIHETTYVEEGETYHTDSHASLIELLPNLVGIKNLKVFLPVHFSQRYSWEEVEEKLKNLSKTDKDLIIYPPKLGSIINWDEKEQNTQIEELNLIGKF